MADVFDEGKMRQVLEGHMIEGETLLAGVHGVGTHIETVTVLPNYVLWEDRLIPTEPGSSLIKIRKTKYSRFDVYIGITDDALIIAECEPEKWLYEMEKLMAEGDLREVSDACELSLSDIGVRFPFEFITDCTIKKIWMGAYRCEVNMESGSVLKFMLPKRGGLGGGMPNHTKYRDMILKRLSDFCV